MSAALILGPSLTARSLGDCGVGWRGRTCHTCGKVSRPLGGSAPLAEPIRLAPSGRGVRSARAVTYASRVCRSLSAVEAVGGGGGAVGGGTGVAETSPSFGDCSFGGGLDPDFLQLSGATVSPQGTLTVSPSQGQVQLEASESSDPGDSSGRDTLSVT